MTLMKAYETILRSEGILPVSDSKIYNLVFKVFQKSETAVKDEEDTYSREAELMESLRRHQH